MNRLRPIVWLALVVSTCLPLRAALDDDLGRNDVRVYSDEYAVPLGVTVTGAALPERLDALGYARVSEQPTRPGRYFWGHERFWIYRRAYRSGGVPHAAELFGLRLERASGRIVGFVEPSGRERVAAPAGARLEPQLLAESLDPRRASRVVVELDRLPEHLWRAVLAAEDARFYRHRGVDGRSLARAALRNARAGRVVQGGSTITQQLVKMRDLSPKRTLGRKVSEAVRALALEADYDKREILEAYLNRIYFGHVDGVALYGVGTAARAWFSKSVARLDLGESALLAAAIQGPNRLDPRRHPDRARQRQRWVLGRLRELGWADSESIERELRRGLPELRPSRPAPNESRHLLGWVAGLYEEAAPRRAGDGRGAVVETTIDPWLQEAANRALAEGLDRLRSRDPRLKKQALSGALVALDARTGAVLAHVGGDPRARSDGLDRVREARRQPGSTIKPLVLLEAFEDCGERDPLYPSRVVRDAPLELRLDSGDWRPRNYDGAFDGPISIRDALVGSRNVPFVRIARWCGFDETADRLTRAGLTLARPVPPSFALGAVELSPLELAEAYTVIGGGGRLAAARPLRRLSRPGGRRISVGRARRPKRVVREATAWLVRDLARDAVERGTGKPAAIDGRPAWGKTGTANDAWFAGGVHGTVAVVWIGLDDGSDLGRSGSAAAAPVWREFMTAVAESRPAGAESPPGAIVERWVDHRSGLQVRASRAGARRELFRRGHEPPSARWYRVDRAVPPVE